MGSRIVVCGEIHLSKDAFARAQDTPLLEFFYPDPEDEDSFHPKAVTARTLFASDGKYRRWARNAYEPATSRWILSASLHDDDWHGADPALMTEALARLKDRDGSDLLAAFVEWKQQLDAAWRIDRGRVTPLERLPELPDPLRRQLETGDIDQALGGLRALVGW